MRGANVALAATKDFDDEDVQGEDGGNTTEGKTPADAHLTHKKARAVEAVALSRNKSKESSAISLGSQAA